MATGNVILAWAPLAGPAPRAVTSMLPIASTGTVNVHVPPGPTNSPAGIQRFLLRPEAETRILVISDDAATVTVTCSPGETLEPSGGDEILMFETATP